MDDVLELFAHTVDVFVYNRMLGKMTWEPMIFTEFGPQFDDDTFRVKFVPIRYSPAFPSNVVFHWTLKQLQRRVKMRVDSKAG